MTDELAALREIAEYPNSFQPLGPHDERVVTPRYTLCMGAGAEWNTVQRQRFALEELDEVLEEVRARLRTRGRTSTQWEVGSAALPEGLAEMLLERGLARDRDPYAVALVLRSPPPPAPEGLEARRVASFEEFAEASRVQHVAFEMPAEQAADDETHLQGRWEAGVVVMHAVWLDGRIIGAGTVAPTEHGLLLYGGATLPDHRGRGAYRALIGARWAEAVERGTPALVTQGGSMSRPILERLGFERVGHVHMLVDRFDA